MKKKRLSTVPAPVTQGDFDLPLRLDFNALVAFEDETDKSILEALGIGGDTMSKVMSVEKDKDGKVDPKSASGLFEAFDITKIRAKTIALIVWAGRLFEEPELKPKELIRQLGNYGTLSVGLAVVTALTESLIVADDETEEDENSETSGAG